MAHIYHPQTGHTVQVPDTAVPTHRRGGWVLLSEWLEQQEQVPPRFVNGGIVAVPAGDEVPLVMGAGVHHLPKTTGPPVTAQERDD